MIFYKYFTSITACCSIYPTITESKSTGILQYKNEKEKLITNLYNESSISMSSAAAIFVSNNNKKYAILHHMLQISVNHLTSDMPHRQQFNEKDYIRILF